MLQAGASRVNITPFVGGPMAGYSNRDKGSESIHDELYAKALVLDDGEASMALVTSDLLWISSDLAAEVRALVKASVGIEEDHVLLCGSHTHFGPNVNKKKDSDDPGDVAHCAYVDVLAQKLATAVKLAFDGRRPARIGSGSDTAEGISYNRRLVREDGKVEMSLTLPPPYQGLTFGPVDPEVGVLKVEGEDEGDVIATLINFACHPVSSTDRRYEITADFPGYAMDLVERTEGGICLFALGCAGNIVPIQRQGRSKRQVGLSLGGVALKALQWVQTTDEAKIRVERRQIELPLRPFPELQEMDAQIEAAKKALEEATGRNAEDRELKELGEALQVAQAMPRWAERLEWATSRSTEIQAFWIGNISLVGLPGEVFVELGMQIKEAVQSSPTFVVSLSNDATGYIPIRQAYDEGGYESTVSALAPGSGEHLVQEAVALAASTRGA